MDPPDPDAMEIDTPETTATAQDAISSSVESETYRKTFKILSKLDKHILDVSWTRDKALIPIYYKYLLMIATASGMEAFQVEDRAIVLLFLLELYHNAPKKYLEMLMIAMRDEFPEWIVNLSKILKEDKAEYNTPLENIYAYLARRGSTQLVDHVRQDVDEKEKNTLFRNYLRCLEPYLESYKKFCSDPLSDHRLVMHYKDIRTKSPFIKDVNQAIHDAVDQCLKKVVERMSKFLKDDNSLRGGESGVQPEDTWEKTNVLLLYGVSGSGKTRSIERLLRKFWGYYLLPGNLSLNTQRSGDNLYDPRREGYSSDSCLLWNLIKNRNNVVPGMNIHDFPVGEWSRRLILSHHLLFDRFLEVANKMPGTKTPANWLRFQKSCSTDDPFKTIFRLLLLIIDGPTSLGLSMKHADKVLEKETFIYCLDEAQCYVNTHIEAKYYVNALIPKPFECIKNLLQIVSDNILLELRARGRNKDTRYVVSGTSLKLKKTIASIQSTEQLSTHSLLSPRLSSTTCTTFTDFPLLTSAQQLAELIKENELELKDDELELIQKHGIRLRGRYLWSALYVEHLKEHLKGHANLNSTAISTAISNAADTAMREAKDSLKKRLSRLQKGKYDAILEELCWVVIQSDLLDKPIHFEKDEDHLMITEAFAVVEKWKDSSIGTLKEQLAMDAAREWFRENEMYHDILNKYLRFSTNDAGSFGKAAEWFLAFELYNRLHHSDRMAGSKGEGRDQKVLELLSKASEDGKEPIESKGTKFSKRIARPEPLELALTHQLVEGRSIGYSHDRNRSFHSGGKNPNFGSVVPIWEWMESIRKKKEPVASFYFPDNNCGPDIVFSLKSKDKSKDKIKDRVLCVLQLKTGAVDDVKKAMRTTNLWMSYATYDDDGKKREDKGENLKEDEQKMKKELEHWKNATIIRILASTATAHRVATIADFLKQEKEEKQVPEGRQQFFLCNKETTKELFGEYFTNLIDAKTSDENVAEVIKTWVGVKRGLTEVG